MDTQISIWILTVGCLFIAFLFRCIEKVREEMSGDHAMIELKDENEIYEYDIDDREDCEDL
ncbi:MAG: hypothetical protein Q4D36_07925 [Bacteroidales bacterium]|nr:hypothetical protein [Bacteroidales bacterium]